MNATFKRVQEVESSLGARGSLWVGAPNVDR